MATWNNHGSIVEFKGQWYVFYHRATHNSKMMRKACVEPIFFNEDGSIDEVEMTSQGAGPALSAFEKIDAERACLLFGNTRIQLFELNNEALTEIQNNDKAAFKYIDFKEGVKSVEMNVKAMKNGGSISIYIDDMKGKKIGAIEVPSQENGEWEKLSAKIEKTSGVHAVWLKFNGTENNLFELDWLRFSK
jgi:hypothetical protein